MTAVNINNFDMATERLIIEAGVCIVFGYDARDHSAKGVFDAQFCEKQIFSLTGKRR